MQVTLNQGRTGELRYHADNNGCWIFLDDKILCGGQDADAEKASLLYSEIQNTGVLPAELLARLPGAPMTAGPWYVSKCGNNADQWMINDETGRTIGLSYHGEMNAQAMASAPELLEFAQRAMLIFECDGCKCGEVHGIYENGELCPLCAAEAAIAKAEGR